MDLAIKAKVKRFGLFHLNQDRTDEGVDQMVEECRQIIAKRNATLECFAVGTDMSFVL